MDTKIKELIAIGASVTANCVPCLKYHFAKARKAGTSDDEIREAIDVGRMVRKGAAGKWDEEAMTIFSAASDSKTATTQETCGNL
jgi:AhpD family alkylhydroperoxidase